MLRRTASRQSTAYIADVGTLILAGIVAHFVWEVWANIIAPMTPIARTIVVDHILGPAFGMGQFISTLLLQGFLAIAVYPILYFYFYWPTAVALGLNWPAAAVLFGVLLWIITTFFYAHMLAGYRAFFDFNDYSVGILIGSILYALTLAAVVQIRGDD